MSFACPHCTKEIAKVLTEDDHIKRLEAKNGEITTLRGQLTDFKSKVEGIATIEKERDDAVGKVKKMERTVALAGRQVTDPKVVSAFELVYESEMSGKKPEEVVPFDDFTKWGADTHPLLASALKPPAAGTTTTTTPAKPTPPGAAGGTGGPPPPTTKGMSVQQVSAYLQSPEYLALPSDKKREKLAEMRSQTVAAAASEGAA
jgi:hypothetical protein